MANIGSFTRAEDGIYAGSIKTLQLNTQARLTPVEHTGNGPDFRVYAGNVEIGAAWKRISQQDRHYISVKLDDPSLPAPIYASLHEADEPGQYILIWSRPQAR